MDDKNEEINTFEHRAQIINQKLRALQKCCKDPEQKVCD